MTNKIQLLPVKSLVEAKEFATRPFCICDFYLAGAEHGTLEEKTKALWYDNILNIDHHAPLKEMERQISSGNLAIQYVKQHGPTTLPIFINHTDCDSMLSSAIMAGILPPEDKYGEAVIAADHTGQENQIADLLQSIGDLRDYNYSLEMLLRLEQGKPLDTQAEECLAQHLYQRAQAKALAPSFTYTSSGVAYLMNDSKIDSAFLPAQLPDAKVILLGIPMKNGNLEVKVRLGIKGDGISLNKLNLPQFGGRWNAGGTKRSGGTTYSLEEYVSIVDKKIDECKNAR